MKNGTLYILEERNRQINEEKFDSTNDDKYTNNELCLAAASYLIKDPIPHWPFDMKWWKPKFNEGIDGRIRDLQKAGALISAEIDRLLREKENNNNK